MINVTIEQSMLRKTIRVDESTTTLLSVLKENGIDTAYFAFRLNGDAVTDDMMGKTFVQNDVYENCLLTAVTKDDMKTDEKMEDIQKPRSSVEPPHKERPKRKSSCDTCAYSGGWWAHRCGTCDYGSNYSPERSSR